MLVGSGDINVADGLRFMSPKGFTRINEPKKLALQG